MDSFELNKIAGAVLGALLLVMGLNIVSGILFQPRKAGEAGYPLPVPQEETAVAAAGQAAPQTEPLPVLLASADIAKGQSAARKCSACHTFEKGGANRVGPNLHDVYANAKARIASFGYSAALKGKGGEWTAEDLNGFLLNPKGWLPGTIMAFAGISSANERADIIKYLQSLSDAPKPLPAP